MVRGRRGAGVVMAALAGLVLAGCANSQWRVDDRNREVVKAVVDAVNAGRLDRLDGLMARDYVRHCQATPDITVNDLADFKDFLEMERATFPDGRLAISFFTTEGDRVAFWGTYTGTQRGPMGRFGATGRRIQVDVAGVHRLDGGKIVESWITWDNLTVLQELDLLPPLPEEDPGAE